jgi:hypothetical protein
MYYRISENVDLEVIGYYPPVNYKPGYNPQGPNAHWNVKGNVFPDFSPELELVIHENAVPTNFLNRMSICTFGIIIDEQLKEIIEQHKLPPHHYYPIKVYHKKTLLKYYWLHWIVNDFWDVIDYENTLVKRYSYINPANYTFEPIKSKQNLDAFLKKKEIGFNFGYEKMVFRPGFDYDIYETQGADWNNLISEKLKNAMDDGGMTGFEAHPYKPLNVDEDLV